MVSIVLASHGGCASGVLDAASMVFGDLDGIEAVSLKPGESPEDFSARLRKAAAMADSEQVLFLVDLWGGTPFNQACVLLEEHSDWAIVTGLNLPMLIEASLARQASESAAALATHLYGTSRESVKIKPVELEFAPAAQKTTAVTSSLPSEGPGPEICWTRIDSRLLHGQVAMAWSKEVSPTRIVVVSDGVAHDDLRKTLIVQAAPPGVEANVIPISKLIEVAHDPRLTGERLFLLFDNPADILRCVEGGVEIDHVNVGSMAHSAGKTAAFDVVSVDAADVAAMRSLREAGCKLGVQMLPSDKETDIWERLDSLDIA